MLETELVALEKKSADLTARWKSEKEKLSGAQKLKNELDQLRVELANAQRRGEYQRAGELAYGRIPEIEKRLKEMEASEGKGAMVEEAVTPNHIAQVVSRWTGIPVDRMLEGEKEKLLRMEEQIGKRVVGQAEAVKAVSTAVRRARAGLQDPNRPIGSFMFLGPTGVGKTELTKALAEFLFDDESALIRIDMSEYMEKHSVARLIGAPPGYVGYEEGGALTEAVRRRPYQVVLFDEIEKAHPDVFNVLLQVLDDGRLTDGQGHTVDFRNTLIVMTSNLGAELLVAQPEGQDTEAVRDQVMAIVRASFRPEFLNRIDEIILFHRLQKSEMARIVDIQIARLARLLEERKIAIKLEPSARDWLADKGWEPAYGARPLKRVIQKSVQDPLAELVLSGRIKDGDKVVISAEQAGAQVQRRNGSCSRLAALPCRGSLRTRSFQLDRSRSVFFDRAELYKTRFHFRGRCSSVRHPASPRAAAGAPIRGASWDELREVRAPAGRKGHHDRPVELDRLSPRHFSSGRRHHPHCAGAYLLGRKHGDPGHGGLVRRLDDRQRDSGLGSCAGPPRSPSPTGA